MRGNLLEDEEVGFNQLIAYEEINRDDFDYITEHKLAGASKAQHEKLREERHLQFIEAEYLAK